MLSNGRQETKMDKISEGKNVFNIEIKALKKVRDSLDETFTEILDLVTSCSGKVIITGMGKQGHIASKLAATFASLGTSSFYLHPAEALHGDLGMVSKNDIVVALSFSGESDEIVRILPNIKLIGATLIGITGNGASTLASAADVLQVLPKFEEACALGLAPTSSTTAMLCYGDALAVVASEVYGFKDADFGIFHPAGSLGKKLVLRVDDLMMKGEKNAVINHNATLKDAIIELSKKGLGILSIADESEELKGVITDGDLRRQLEKNVDVYSMHILDIMTISPKTILSGKMAVDALAIMNANNINALPVIKDRKLIGTIRLQDIINVGICAELHL
jgi:arabinose-5-phosphate isomerase